jgi:hypothetical protein
MKKFSAVIVVAFGLLGSSVACKTEKTSEWKPVEGRIMTRWAAEVKPDLVLPEYPRPQMVRAEWFSLNGLWDYAIVAKDAGRPTVWEGKILVPFAVESALSGVGKPVGAGKELWYRRTVAVPKTWRGGKVLLHFGAVDWESTVWVNGREAGTHRGGYDPFTFDITDALAAGTKQEIVLRVLDPTDEANSPIARGKQVMKPHSGDGHLADCVDRACAGNLFREAEDHAGHRSRDVHFRTHGLGESRRDILGCDVQPRADGRGYVRGSCGRPGGGGYPPAGALVSR